MWQSSLDVDENSKKNFFHRFHPLSLADQTSKKTKKKKGQTSSSCPFRSFALDVTNKFPIHLHRTGMEQKLNLPIFAQWTSRVEFYEFHVTVILCRSQFSFLRTENWRYVKGWKERQWLVVIKLLEIFEASCKFYRKFETCL